MWDTVAERVTRKRVDWTQYGDDDADLPVTDVPSHPALLQFRTDRAAYHVHPGNHSTATALPADVVGRFDGIVLEDAYTRYEELSLNDLYRTTQWRELLDVAFATPMPSVFLLDLPSTLDSIEAWTTRFRRRIVALLLGTFLLVPAGWLLHPLAGVVATIVAVPGALLLFEEGARRLSIDRFHDRPSRLRGLAMLPWFWTVYGGRSALVAHKLERFVAPKVARERGRRPAFLIDYGSHHADVYCYLRYPRLRQFVLAVHERRNWSEKNASYADTVCEFALSDVDPMYRNEMTEREISYKQVLYERRRSSDAT